MKSYYKKGETPAIYTYLRLATRHVRVPGEVFATKFRSLDRMGLRDEVSIKDFVAKFNEDILQKHWCRKAIADRTMERE